MNPIDREKLTDWIEYWIEACKEESFSDTELLMYLSEDIESGALDASPTGAERVSEEPDAIDKFVDTMEHSGWKTDGIASQRISTIKGVYKCCDNPNPQTFGPNDHIPTPTTVCMGCGKLLKEADHDPI